MFNSEDARWMSRALELARRGRFTTSPNPSVGCVIVQNGILVGEGYHQQAGGPHAEVFALRQAGPAARGATAYVTLEPCSHHGRTPPCAQGLIDAGVARVVAASVDPNPRVAGRGLAMLTDAGIDAEAGLMSEAAEAINTGFMHRMRTGLPFVTVKLAASLDGRTALANGESKWITGPAARRDVQRHRALSCATLSGADTVLTDDASLNVRWDELPESVQAGYSEAGSAASALRQPLRVIIDTRNRLTPGLKLFAQPGPILLLRGEITGGLGEQVEECVLPLADNGRLDLPLLLAELGRRQVNHLWVEAGARLSGALLSAALVGELVLYQAPKLMGTASRGLFELPELTAMSQVPELEWRDCRRVGTDLKLTARVKN
ncbi:bifunctional diaminohydroxyphosphoribosylaminopyrimidine deaminase/5-amino-6-(5-phosphoribosylamino)uracil reductase RibD [Oceanisphaera psychrotolerans]|uniref:Riboflavin biosynthesis protein RibD n=1 Tax=Oceanisphaera psychrotolerans TaxID=1414654 RepID=A0A1J4QIK8_9GAMM|nr:bifunctional diaminohydroxyphosphoribosylaminopyrimidine deaminase/5-amino-6-(5-phosphoribosylamino)uracil reductase RibD [Oceanisphaera psychrotolerans]OIN13757.1 riboflavin biosynthesis protein RibD [Oceanisphaera psychrotolerans]